MAVAFVAESHSNGATGANANPGEPAGTVSGHVLVGLVMQDGANATTPAMPTGWTTLYGPATVGTGSNTFKYAVGYIVRGASAAATTFTNGNAAHETYILAFSGVNTSSPIDSQSASGTTGTTGQGFINPPATTAVSSAAMAVSGGVNWAGSNAGWTASTGYTIRSNNANGNDSALQTKLLSAAGSEDPANITGANSTSAFWNGFTITLAPTAAGGTTVTDTPTKGLRAGAVTQTVTIGRTVTDTATKGLRAGSLAQTVAIGNVVTDSPAKAVRAGSVTQAVVIGTTVTDTPAKAVRAGSVTQAVITGRTVTDSPSKGARGASSATETVVTGRVVTDTPPRGVRAGSVTQTLGIGTPGATTVTDSPSRGLRVGAVPTTVTYGRVVTDRPAGIRLGVVTQTVSVGASSSTTVSDHPFGVRLGAVTQTVTIGTLPPPPPTTYRFVPAGVVEALPGQRGVADFGPGPYHMTRGVSVVLRDGHFVAQRFPDTTDMTDGQDVFLGGHEYVISAAAAAALTADGFGAHIT